MHTVVGKQKHDVADLGPCEPAQSRDGKVDFERIASTIHTISGGHTTRLRVSNYITYPCNRSRDSSVSIVSDYGLDDWGSIPDRGRGFFL
jgi:hypothetical protein